MRTLFVGALLSFVAACGPRPAAVQLNGPSTTVVHALTPVPLPTVTVVDASGAPIASAPAVSWSVSPADAATLDLATGTLTPTRDGTIDVVASLGELGATFEVVVSLPDRIVLVGAAGPRVLQVGGTTDLDARVLAGATEVPGMAIAWTSQSPDIVTVDAEGVATAVAAGEALILAEAAGLSVTQPVVVVAPEPALVDAEPMD